MDEDEVVNEFATPDLLKVWRSAGFRVQVLTPHDSNSTAFVERVIGTIQNYARAYLIGAGIEDVMWEDASEWL